LTNEKVEIKRKIQDVISAQDKSPQNQLVILSESRNKDCMNIESEEELNDIVMFLQCRLKKCASDDEVEQLKVEEKQLIYAFVICVSYTIHLELISCDYI